MSSSVSNDELEVQATRVVVTDQHLAVDLADGRTISAPLEWFPRLLAGSPSERNRIEIDAYGIHWPDLDEDISIKGLLLGHKSGESQRSLERWRESWARGERVPVLTLPIPPDLANEFEALGVPAEDD